MIERFRLFGDRRRAAQWLPFARKRIAWWKKQNLPGVWNHKWWVPGGEVRVHVDRVAQSEWIWIRIDEGDFWWWTYFFGFAPPEEGGGRIAQIVAADVPGKISQPVEATSFAGLYKYRQIFAGDRWLGDKTPQLAKAGGRVVVAVYEVHADPSPNNSFLVRLGFVIDNNKPQKPAFFLDYEIPIDPGAPVVGIARVGPDMYPLLFAEEWALLYGEGIGGVTATEGTLVRGRYPTADNPSIVLATVSDIDLSDVAGLSVLPGPNPGAGTALRTAGDSRIGFGYWQGNGSSDPLLPPPAPEALKDRDFYSVAVVETTTVIPSDPLTPSITRYQQAAVVFRRSIDDPGTNLMLTSWLLAEYVQKSATENTVLYSAYEYQGKLWVIFGRYVSRFPEIFGNKDRDWYFDQYVIDKSTGELLHTQLDCGIRAWAETDAGIYGYAMPDVTFTYAGSTATEAKINWMLRRYSFGVDANALSLFPDESDPGIPINLLSVQTTVTLGSSVTAGRAHDNFNHLILLQH